MTSRFTDAADAYGRRAAPVAFDLRAVPPEFRAQVEKACRKGLKDAEDQGMVFEKSVVIEVKPNAQFCIPEIGAGGEAGSGGKINILYDPAIFSDPDRFPNPATDGIAREVTHELNHEWRLQTGHQPETLGDFLVSEGLAVTAEEQPGHAPLPYTRYKSADFRAEFIQRVRDNLDKPFNPKDDFNKWFFGEGETPDFGGYTLGRDIVRSYLAANDCDLTKANNLDAKAVIRDWVDGKFLLESEQQYGQTKAVQQPVSCTPSLSK